MNQESQPVTDRGQSADSPAQMPKRAWKDIAIRTWKESSADNIGLISAGVAFYGFLALVPLLGATVLIYGLVADPHTVVEHSQKLMRTLPAGVGNLVADQLGNVVETNDGKKGFGLILALALALWGARNAAGSIITGLNIAYEEEETRGFVRVTLLALIMTVGAVVLAVLAFGAVALLAGLDKLMPGLGPVGEVLGKVVTYVLLGAAAAAGAATVFRYAPARDKPRWTWITPGSVGFAVLWVLLTLGFGFYVSNFGNYGATYGSLSAVVVLLTWLYLSSYVLLFGAELNSEIEHQTARDTTEGPERPLGARGAWSADHVADGPQAGGSASGELGETSEAGDEPAAMGPVPTVQADQPQPSRRGEFAAGRAVSGAGGFVGLQKIGLVASALATAGLAMLRTRGRARGGALLLVTAASISLLKRED